MKVLSWNLNGRVRGLHDQVAAIVSRYPHIIALQEVTRRTVPMLAGALADAGFPHGADSFSLSPADFEAKGPRRYGLVVASCYPLSPLPPARFQVPWPERILSGIVATPDGPVELITSHIPPGSSNGWVKIEMLEGLYTGLRQRTAFPRILCGDFNTPQDELRSGEIITWAQRIRSDGSIALRAKIQSGPGSRWDSAERNVLSGLAPYGLVDVFRALHGFAEKGHSWVLRRHGVEVPRRFDHIFASESLHPLACRYVHEVRREGLSDHSMIEAEFGQ